MALNVEDGGGYDDSDAYQELTDIADYAMKHGLPFPTNDIPAAEAAARRAATWLDAHYRTRLPGSRTNGRGQALEWPRINAHDVAGNAIASDEIPIEWLAANSEVAVRELANPGFLSPDITPGRVKKSVSVSGAVAVEYAIGETDLVFGERPIITLVDDLLSGLLAGGVATGQTLVQFLNRA